MWLLPWGVGVCSYMRVSGTMRQGSFSHPSAMLPHCWSLKHQVFTILASVENWESYLSSQYAQWSYENGTQKRSCESQSRKMSWATHQQSLLRLVPCVTRGESQTHPPLPWRVLCSWFAGCSPFGDPAWKSFPRTGSYWLSFEWLRQVSSSCFQTGAQE